MATASRAGGPARDDLCRHCGTVIDFLSSCPSCGTVAGIDPSLSDGEVARLPKLTLVAPPPPTQSATAAAAGAHRSTLPEELTRAWDITTGPKAKPRRARLHRRHLVVGVLALVVAAGVTAGVLAARSSIAPTGATHAQVQAPAPASQQHAAGPQHFTAPGAAFTAAFPAATTESHAKLRLAGIPYVSTAYTAFSGSQMFSAAVYPFPLGPLKMTAEQFLENFAQRTATNAHLSIPSWATTTFRGLPALTTVFRSPGGDTYVKMLAILDGHIGYVLSVSGGSSSPPGFATFVASFHLPA